MSKIEITNEDSIFINKEEYIKKSSITTNLEPADKLMGLELVLIRTYSAGVHFGYLKKRDSTLAGIEVELLDARRIYYWEGAASLSQLAMEGVTKPKNCKISMEVNSIELVAIEIIKITKKAELILKGVSIWKV